MTKTISLTLYGSAQFYAFQSENNIKLGRIVIIVDIVNK